MGIKRVPISKELLLTKDFRIEHLFTGFVSSEILEAGQVAVINCTKGLPRDAILINVVKGTDFDLGIIYYHFELPSFEGVSDFNCEFTRNIFFVDLDR